MTDEAFTKEVVRDEEMLRQWVADHKSANHDAHLVRDEAGTLIKGVCKRCDKEATVNG